MILSIDFGGAVAKALIVQGDKFEVVEVPLGFRTRPRLTVPETLQYVIQQAVGNKKVDKIYASGEIAAMELKEILTQPPLDPVQALKGLGLPLVVVGAGIIYVNGQAARGLEVEEKIEEIANWLPFAVRPSEIQNYLANKKIYPQIVPTTEREIRLEQAAARVRIRIRSFLDSQFSTLNSDYIIASGGVLSKAPTASCAVLTLLDALQPEGLLKIYLDQEQALTALAALAVYEEETAQKILDQDPFTFLGTTFSAAGEGSFEIDVGLSEPQELGLAAGELGVFPLETGKMATVRFETKSQKGEFEAEGGPAGLVIDARGRPIELPRGETERMKVLQKWEESICFVPLSKK